MTELSFRFATTADVRAICALVESAYRGEASLQGWTSEANLLGGQRIDEDMVVELLAADGAQVLLAENDGRLVACCELKAPERLGVKSLPPETEPGDHHDPAIVGAARLVATIADGGSAYFGMFAVDPTLQGGGVGKFVLAEAERYAHDELGASRMEMTVIEQRPELIAWYERRGYVRTGVLKAFPYGDERFGEPKVDDLRMAVLEKPLG